MSVQANKIRHQLQANKIRRQILCLICRYLKHAGLREICLRLLKALHMLFDEVDATAEIVRVGSSWRGKRHIYHQPSFLVAQLKRRHFLFKPEEVGRAAMEDWLTGVPAAWGSSGEGHFIESTPICTGWMNGGDCAEVFEALGRFEEGIVAAETDIRNFALHGPLLTQSYTAVGRCQAKLGRTDEAVAAFNAAIGEARRCELPFLEMLAHRDYIVNVLDRQGQRDSQLVGLGACISRMVLPPEEYSAVLGSGIDAAAAVAAFKACRQ